MPTLRREQNEISDLNNWIAGTTNQVGVTDDGDGSVTLTTPQDIHSGANPTFSNITLDKIIAGTAGDMPIKLGDAAGVKEFQILDSGDAKVASIDSDGNFVNQIGVDGVYELTNASDVSKVKLNSNGDSYFLGGNVGFGIQTPNHLVDINGDLAYKRTAIGAANYDPSALTTDLIIAMTDTSAARAVTISTEDIQSGSTSNPRIFIVKDEGGQAGANNITVSGETGNIDGAASFAIANNYGSITIYADGTNLWII